MSPAPHSFMLPTLRYDLLLYNMACSRLSNMCERRVENVQECCGRLLGCAMSAASLILLVLTGLTCAPVVYVLLRLHHLLREVHISLLVRSIFRWPRMQLDRAGEMWFRSFPGD